MEEKKNIFGFIRQTFATYGIMVTIFMIFSILVGDIPEGFSSLFILGRKGLSLATLSELLLLAVIITVLQNVFLTDMVIKNMSIIARNILFLVTVLVVIITMIFVFEWFPVNSLMSWSGFIICYLISVGISILVIRLRENTENKRMQKALEKYNQRAS